MAGLGKAVWSPLRRCARPPTSFRSYGKDAAREVFIVSSVRTPIGSFRGSLSAVPATELGSVAIRAAVDRAHITPEQVRIWVSVIIVSVFA